jgi:hypothetical protein
LTGTKNNLTLPILDERRICPISTKWGCYFLDSTVIYHSFKGIWKRYRGQFQTNAPWAVPEIDCRQKRLILFQGNHKISCHWPKAMPGWLTNRLLKYINIIIFVLYMKNCQLPIGDLTVTNNNNNILYLKRVYSISFH